MAIPTATCPANISGDYCCNTLSAIADRIRTVAFSGLCGCLDQSCADREFRTFVSIGPTIQDPLGDSLIVHMPAFGPTPGSTNDRGNILGFGVHQGDFMVELRDNGWPQVTADDMTAAIIAPDSELVHAATMHSMGHGELMYRSLTDAVQKREMFVGTPNKHIGRIHISGLVPIPPSAFQVGWKCMVSVETTL